MELESGVKGVRRSFLLRGDPKNEGHSGGLILFIESQEPLLCLGPTFPCISGCSSLR